LDGRSARPARGWLGAMLGKCCQTHLTSAQAMAVLLPTCAPRLARCIAGFDSFCAGEAEQLASSQRSTEGRLLASPCELSRAPSLGEFRTALAARTGCPNSRRGPAAGVVHALHVNVGGRRKPLGSLLGGLSNRAAGAARRASRTTPVRCTSPRTTLLHGSIHARASS
jgi:hypothetical protein